MLGVFPSTALIESLLKKIENQIEANHGFVIFTTSQSWVVPPGVHKIKILVVGGGGGGGGGYSSTYTGGLGGSGGIEYAEALVTPGETLNIFVGAGGAAGNGGASPTAGSPGGSSYILISGINTASLAYANGGGGGGAATSSANGSNGSGGVVAPVSIYDISAFGINGNSGATLFSSQAQTPIIPLGVVVNNNNIQIVPYYFDQPNSGVGGAGGGVSQNGTSGVAGFVVIWWGDD